MVAYSQLVRFGDEPLESHNQNFFQLNAYDPGPYVIASLTRGWICDLQLLQVLASAVILRSESRGTMTTFYCLRFETPPTWRAKFPYIQGVPRHLGITTGGDFLGLCDQNS
jgi:hypothetical protein